MICVTFPHNGAIHFQATSLDTSICICNGIWVGTTDAVGYPAAPAAPAMPPPSSAGVLRTAASQSRPSSQFVDYP